MRDLGPWASDRRVAVAVSGGADSLALAVLTRNWARAGPLALVVDHRLRAGSTEEAEATRGTLARLGIPSHLLTLDLAPGNRLQERARRARHAAFADACKQAGLLDLLLGHHRADQQETIRMRARAGSGPEGLAGMAALSERNRVRLARPLLGIHPGRLRATLQAAGVAWIEDPSNHDPRFERARLRATPGPIPPASPTTRDQDVAWLADHVTLHEAGFAVLPFAPMPPGALAHLLQTLSGREHPPRRAEAERLARDPRPATLHGIRLLRADRLGGLIACREPSALAGPVTAKPDAVWDNRFRMVGGAVPPAWTIAGFDGRKNHASDDVPAAVLPSLPAIYDDVGVVRAAPHLGIHDKVHEIDVIFAPALPIAPSFFMSARQPGWMTVDCLPCAPLTP